MSENLDMSNLPFLCVAQIIFELSDSSADLHSCLLVNRMWCKCAVAYLWRTPFYWNGHRAVKMVIEFLRLLPNDCLEDLEYVIGIHIPAQNMQPMFNYLSFVRTMNIMCCIEAVECFLADYFDIVNDTDIRLLSLRICRGMVKNCPLLMEIDMAGHDIGYYGYKWTARSWNLFNLKDSVTNINQLKQLRFSQEFPPDILYSAAEKLSNLELFEIAWSENCMYIDGIKWCDAISKLIGNQKSLKVAYLNLNFSFFGTNLKSICKALYTQAKTLIKVKILFAGTEISKLIDTFGQLAKLHYIKLVYCTLSPTCPLELPPDAFSNLRVLKINEIETNFYGIDALLGNVKECLETLCICYIEMNADYNAELWRKCAKNAPNLSYLKIQLDLEDYVQFIQMALPLWQNLRKLCIVINEPHNNKDSHELLSNILSLAGTNLPASVKFLKLDAYCKLPLAAFTTFLSTCSASLESFSLRVDDLNDSLVNTLLDYMGNSLQSVYLKGTGALSAETKAKLNTQIPRVDYFMKSVNSD
ncbi:25_t:CDS:1 [Paraglomus brasilianum]|uniref:25_t:CDS:1 n=1 Tax=Paraglomus brasilianum TaxID=144538 RepID=A0A9N9H4E3_9GLOM|nr:25_t:CDS:1 [Paraglomus brasilianum]